ncbi:MAG: hypothetical protein HETSPECPRED_009742 [Heterodermia speciosa]|uniref:Uncharacterized protein n=1 Tax=Heterodermia speciosa TaxID=116794 RepID=A0A8H3FZU0_9LECA|nr:MAG: hypothetical protein HETSPECPRED_009742 [Heterodermia speciosa]
MSYDLEYYRNLEGTAWEDANFNAMANSCDDPSFCGGSHDYEYGNWLAALTRDYGVYKADQLRAIVKGELPHPYASMFREQRSLFSPFQRRQIGVRIYFSTNR